MISKLVIALRDQSELVRQSACSVLGHIGEKAATNKVISTIVSALGNQSAEVRWSACSALGQMGAKAATNEVISELWSSCERGEISFCDGCSMFRKIFRAPEMMKQVDAKIMKNMLRYNFLDWWKNI